VWSLSAAAFGICCIAFPDFNTEDIDLAPVPLDILIQIRSDRLDVNIIASLQVQRMLQGHVELQDQLQGFRYLDGRNLSGFVDAPYNPKGRAKRQVALVDAAQQPVFAAGSYVYLQRLAFDAVAWQQLAVSEQEEIMGYDKVSGKRLAAAMLLPDSHIALMQPDPDSLPGVLQQNMPFCLLPQQGLIQLNFAADAAALQLQLTNRLGLAIQGSGYDLLLNYCRIELSAAFFAPSISFLELSAKV
jgi:putative iron-dependent peroxidase